uniref:NADH-ubiquinone oxidoreductase chain 4 n=1 Tax=Micronecta sahlbergii TaxID=2304347 RepID=A0A346LZK6_9HEMI|nr:NADH dehydrogenase subunit 4 [Micronecta sahlbergii]AXQ02201.1 NADH dehydrogenase subunit 4 [Micronecta sahlbergii]
MMIFFSLLSMIFIMNTLVWWEVCIILLMMSFFITNFYHLGNFYMNLSYFLGSDMMSNLLIILSFWILILMFLSSFSVYKFDNNSVEFNYVCLLLLLFLFLTFSVNSIFLFYLFFEASLIPTLFLILGWGYQPERLSAGYYLLFYTLFASLPMLICIFFINNFYYTMSFDMINIYLNMYMYLSLIMAFLVKMPLFFFHFWLPKAHVEAPVSGSMILAGVLLKLGGYGLIRVMKFFSGPLISVNLFWIVLSLWGMVMVGFICLSQTDIKSLIAYSSVGHMGMVICGIMTLNYWGLYGSLVMMIAHGLCSSGLFSLANMVYERTGSRSFFINKGLLGFMPSLSFFWFMFSVDNMAAPPSLNLVGEILLINSIMGWGSLSFIFLSLGSFLSCCYSIYLYSITQHGHLYSGMFSCSSGSVREFYLLLMHLIPLNLLILKVDYVTLFF